MTLTATTTDLSQELAAHKEDAVTKLIGYEFRQDIRISIRRPRWMPDRLYRWLMKTIVIVEGPLIFSNPLQEEQ